MGVGVAGFVVTVGVLVFIVGVGVKNFVGEGVLVRFCKKDCAVGRSTIREERAVLPAYTTVIGTIKKASRRVVKNMYFRFPKSIRVSRLHDLQKICKFHTQLLFSLCFWGIRRFIYLNFTRLNSYIEWPYKMSSNRAYLISKIHKKAHKQKSCSKI